MFWYNNNNNWIGNVNNFYFKKKQNFLSHKTLRHKPSSCVDETENETAWNRKWNVDDTKRYDTNHQNEF